MRGSQRWEKQVIGNVTHMDCEVSEAEKKNKRKRKKHQKTHKHIKKWKIIELSGGR